jgi:gamma-glutamyl phosphate reductase
MQAIGKQRKRRWRCGSATRRRNAALRAMADALDAFSSAILEANAADAEDRRAAG